MVGLSLDTYLIQSLGKKVAQEGFSRISDLVHLCPVLQFLGNIGQLGLRSERVNNRYMRLVPKGHPT